jgi:uncharacterized protein (TIGR03382 family)
MFRRTSLLVAVAGTLASSAAQAQTTTSGPTVSQSGQGVPLRLTPSGASFCGPGTVAANCVSTRPENLNPLGISYADCLADMVLSFSVTLDGFTGSDSLQVWASLGSDCTGLADRGREGTAPVCWGLRTGGLVGIPVSTPQSFTFNVRVQDLVGWQESPPSLSEALNPPAKGVEACSAQATFAAVPMNINFIPLDSDGNAEGTPYQYQINTDMVGPPAPGGVGETVGDTVFNVTWTANSDSDTVGYDIFVDPIPGQEDSESGVASLEAGQELMCPDGGMVSLDSGSADGAGDSSAEAAAPAPLPFDGGCYVITTGGAPPRPDSGPMCHDSNLAGAITEDAGSVAEAGSQPVLDEAGDLLEASVEEGAGGISTVPAQYLYKATSGFTIADKSVGQYTLEGLVDEVTYTVVVAAVDGTGNVGPPSSEVCDYPAPVKDFWQNYEQAGGGAGGYCALESVGKGGSPLAGVAGLVALAAMVRRRRRLRCSPRSPGPARPLN